MFKNKGDDSLMKQIFLISVDLYSVGKTSFYCNLINVAEFYDFKSNFSLDTLDGDTIIRSYIILI